MTVQLVSGYRIAETSSKGNQEKWYDNSTDTWYKLDQFGYEALTETLVSVLLENSNIETGTCFTFVRYRMEKLNVRNIVRNGCASRNFLKPGQSLITVNRLLTSYLGFPLKQKLMHLSSDRKRIAYIAEATADYTGLVEFPRYLTLLFEVDALFCNDDRHLNNIAVIEHNGSYDYCPIFDNGAGLLSNTQLSQMDIMPQAMLSVLRARPLGTTFTRQMNTARSLYGRQLRMPILIDKDIRYALAPFLQYYPERDQGYITDRVATCILTRQKFL